MKRMISTPIGNMVAVAHEDGLLALDFEDGKNVFRGEVVPCEFAHTYLDQIQGELEEYFAGSRCTFHTSLSVSCGTPFQRRVWQALQTIPYGDTWSYGQLAASIGKPTAHRAVANANGKNPLSIIVPCHRVIRTGGALGGYGGGVKRKQWLLAHESC